MSNDPAGRYLELLDELQEVVNEIRYEHRERARYDSRLRRIVRPLAR